MSKKAGAIGISAVLLLGGALPAAAESFANAGNQAAASFPAAAPSAAPSTAPSGNISLDVTDAKIKKDEAVKLARSYVQIPDAYNLDDISLQGNLDGTNARWQMSFSKRVDNRYYGSYNVSINSENGNLIQFNNYSSDPDTKTSYPPKVSLTEAKEVAVGFAKKLYPDKLAQTIYNQAAEDNFKTPLNGQVRYNFQFQRSVNGILYPSDGLIVEVDGNGQINNFNYSWDEKLSFPSADKVIAPSEALGLWNKESKLTLSYFRPYGTNPQDTAYSIAYLLQPARLDALTGEPWGTTDRYIQETQPLTQAPAGTAPKAGQPLTKAQAVEAVTRTFALPANVKLENATYRESADELTKAMNGYWSLRWSAPDTDAKQAGGDEQKMIYPPQDTTYSASVNAETGEVTQFDKYNNMMYSASSEAKEYKVSLDDAKKKAVDLVKALAPHMTHQLYLEYSDPAANPSARGNTNPVYTFAFIRIIDGITTNENVTVRVDGITGEMNSYNNSISNYAYPDKKPELIDAAKAKGLWLGQYKLELQYAADFSSGVYPADISIEKYNVMVAAGVMPYSQTAPTTAKLVYVPVALQPNVTYTTYLDAVTGQWKNNQTGETMVIEKVKATDLEGHWAQRELELMAEYSAIDVKDGKANPDQISTKGEMIKMLVIAMSGGGYMKYDSSRSASFADVAGGSKYFAFVENAVDMKLVEKDPLGKFNPDEPMNRDQMAELIVRALGYNNLAKETQLFKLDVSDAAAITNKGHAALVMGLGIMTPQDGQFRPQDEVTRASAAVAFFRFLEKRNDLSGRSY